MVHGRRTSIMSGWPPRDRISWMMPFVEAGLCTC